MDHGTFLGWIGDDVLHSLYRIADVCVVPSIYEPFGLVALEAMASGCPCIVADTGGLREVVPHEEAGLRFRGPRPRGARRDGRARCSPTTSCATGSSPRAPSTSCASTGPTSPSARRRSTPSSPANAPGPRPRWPRRGRDAALAADERDPLAGFRARFTVPGAGGIYLNGNSLGLLPTATRDRLSATVADWGERAVTAWPDWIDGPARVGDLLGRELLGAGPGEVLVCDSTTVNLYKLCGAVLDQRPRRRGHRPGQLPDRPLRARGPLRAPRARAAALRRRSGRGRAQGRARAGPRRDRAGAGRRLAGRLPLRRARRHARRSSGSPASTVRSSSGTSRTRSARCRST